MSATLFSPIRIGALEFANRIAVSPMCQYSADDGSATDWHLQHWMTLAMTGAGMVTVEMTDVERRGRISHGCLGLYSEHNEAAARRALDAARRVAAPGTKFGVQLAHAGRKASCQRPWEGGGPLGPDEDPWQTVSASAMAYAEGWHVPQALERGRDRGDHRAVRRRGGAGAAGGLRLHRAAQRAWLSAAPVPLAASRTGAPTTGAGRAENRLRLPLEIIRAGAGGGAGADARGAAVGDRLGRGRAGGRGWRGDRGGLRRGGGGLCLLLVGGQFAACRRCRPGRAIRCIWPRRCARRPGCRPGRWG